MILGGAVSLLLLLGGPQAPPEDRPTSGGGYLAEYPIEIGDPWDMGGGGGKYAKCYGPYPKYPNVSNGKHYVLYYAGGEWNTANFQNLTAANDWIANRCARCSL